LEVLAPPPGALARTAATAGDNQFIYRVWAFDLQNAGDTGGRATSMRNYNYDFVLGWLETLQALDPRAHQHAFLAGNYFSLSQKKDDVRRIVAFLAGDAALYPAEKWAWMARAVEISASRLKDTEYALALSQRLSAFDLPSAPFNTLILPAIFLEKLGSYNEARQAIENVLNDRAGTLEQADLNWAQDFLLQLPKS
jgi:hypothetical protein